MSPLDWMASRDLTAADIAKQIGVAVSTVTRPLNGDRYPAFAIMLEFYKLSGGLVGLGDWINLFEGRYVRGEPIPAARTQPDHAKQRLPVGRPRRQGNESVGRRGAAE